MEITYQLLICNFHGFALAARVTNSVVTFCYKLLSIYLLVLFLIMASVKQGQEERTENISCGICNSSFTVKRSLYRHIRKCHPSKTVNIEGNYICSICQTKCCSMKKLQIHIEKTHPCIKLNYENKTFYSVEEFNEWKEEIEKNTLSQFVKKNSTKQLADGRRASYFECHRSGQFRSTTKDRKRRIKCGSSNKIGSTCPANLIVYDLTINDVTEIQVTYQSRHLGHKMEVERLPLSTSEKNELADLIRQGIPKQVILHNLRNQFPPTKRISLTKRKDLENIARDFHIHNVTEMKEIEEEICAIKKGMKKSVLPEEFEVEKATLLEEIKCFMKEIKTKEQLEIMRQSFYSLRTMCVQSGHPPGTITELFNKEF